MELRSFAFYHSGLAALSDPERVALFHLGHLHNELLWTQKQLLWTWNNRRAESEPEANARIFSYLSVMVRFAGQLVETWNAIEKEYYGSQLSRKYHERLKPETNQALDSLRRHFGNRNLIKDIRNKFAFHFDSSHFEARLASLPPMHPHRFLVGDHTANTFFEFAHMVHADALVALVGASDVDAALILLHEEVVGNVPDWLFRFITEFLITILQQTKGVAAQIALENVPSDTEVYLPYFTAPPHAAEVRDQTAAVD